MVVGTLCLIGCQKPSTIPIIEKESPPVQVLDPELVAEIHSLVNEVESLKTTVAALGLRLGRLEHEKEIAARGKMSFAEGLQKRITISFPRNTLEVALKLLSGEIGLPIEIRGNDLQLEGLTKNQSFGLDERDQPAEKVLRAILKRANPDGKLVYVIQKDADLGERLVVTTRAAAARRGDTLPAALGQPAAR